MIGKNCEKTLYREFNKGLEWLQPQVKNIDLEGLEDFDDDDDDFMKIQVIDQFTSFGCYVDRETNRVCGVQRHTSKFLNRPNYTTYFPASLGERADCPNHMEMQLQLLLKFDTRLKLNLVDNNG